MKKLPIYLVESKTKKNLGETFMRFQEYYESPVFKGRFFSVQEFADWYTGQFGKFSYCHDWSGFNIPSWVLEPFKNGSFGPLTEKEEKFIRFFDGVKGNAYIIGITREDPEWLDTLRHELTHGLFFVEEKYRKDVLTCVSHLKPGPAKVALEKMGYGKSVIDDEINAYLMTEPQTLAKNICLSEGKNIQRELDSVFQKHFGYSVVDASVPLLLSGVNNIAI
jgi:hypothetical protein